MADFEYEDAGRPVRGGEVAALMNWLGALVSVALVAGLAFWGYKLMVRDVSGVPVVQALQGPMRVAPQDPGGLAAQHQGLSVNKIASHGQAADPADRLVLAPKPASITQEDPTSSELTAAAAETERMAKAARNVGETDLAVAQALTSTAEADEPVALSREQLITASLQLAGEVAADTPGASSAGDLPEGAIAASISGVSRSLHPLPRPATQVASIAPTLDGGAATSVNITTVDPASIPVGTRLAQLGAFESPDIAKAEWVKLASQFEDVMSEKSVVVQKAQSGGKSFYRLRAMGFEDIADARRFCSALLAENANCIPVITR